MIKAQFDMPKLISSLKKASNAFGDTNQTGVARWGVQTCRELAVSTQVHGKGNARKRQLAAINAGINAVIVEVSDKQFRLMESGKQKNAKIRNRWVAVSPERLLRDPDQCNRWIEQNRDQKGRTKPLPQDDIGIAAKSTLAKVRRERGIRAGIAKGAWLGAGQEIAKRQRGAQRINIGKGFLSYAQKHASRGTARASGNPFRPIAFLMNRARHSASGYVLSESEKNKALGFGLRKTISWYRHATKQALEKS